MNKEVAFEGRTADIFTPLDNSSASLREVRVPRKGALRGRIGVPLKPSTPQRVWQNTGKYQMTKRFKCPLQLHPLQVPPVSPVCHKLKLLHLRLLQQELLWPFTRHGSDVL
jgi:hypothetical protein